VSAIKALCYIVDGQSISGRLCYFACLSECGVPQLERSRKRNSLHESYCGEEGLVGQLDIWIAAGLKRRRCRCNSTHICLGEKLAKAPPTPERKGEE